MTCIKQLLKIKGHEVLTVDANATVYSAIKQMEERDIGSLVVLENGAVVGIMTERDYARNVALKDKTSPNTFVREAMNSRVVCVGLDHTIEDCMELMTRHRVRHLPVLAEKTLVGLVSIGDIVKSVIEKQELTIRQLECYISGDLSIH